MNTTEIDNAMFSNAVTKQYYIGTFASDQIPEVPSPKTCFISNTEPHNNTGEHWVAFYVDVTGNVFYFDPLGLPPVVINHIDFCMLSSDRLVRFNEQQLQAQDSTTCGAHCIRFLIDTCRTGNPTTYLAIWRQTPTLMTERSVKQYVRNSAFLYPLRKK